MELSVYTAKGTDTGRKVNLSDDIFAIEPSQNAIYIDVKQYLANKRQGTHKTKQRNEISGSTRKLKKQKGTGTARAGSIKSPLFKGGGTMFGPQPRDYSFKLNKKVKSLARKSALTFKASEARIKVLEDLQISTPRTKDIISMLTSLSLQNSKNLIIVNEASGNVHLSARNLPKTKVVSADAVHTYDIVHCENVIICEGSVAKFATI